MTIFEPYAHQVAGHCSIFKLDGMVCKPLISRECEFYQTIYREFPPLVPLTPEFHGSITIHNSTKTNTNTTESQLKTNSDNKYTIYHNPSAANNYLSINTVTDISSSTSSSYIVLEDLTAGMSKPCAMDMKIGTRQRFTTSAMLGFRLCGMRVHRHTPPSPSSSSPEGASELYTVDRLFGRGLTPDTVEDPIAAFLFDGSAVRVELIPSILTGLQRMIEVMSDPSLPFRLYTSSLLFAYEGDTRTHPHPHPSVVLRLIDFAHAIPRGHQDAEQDDGVLLGLRNLCVLFQNIAARHGPVLTVVDKSISVMEGGGDESTNVLRDNKHWECRDIITNRCTPIASLLVASPMKTENY